jgi:hypothetical protein
MFAGCGNGIDFGMANSVLLPLACIDACTNHLIVFNDQGTNGHFPQCRSIAGKA